MEYLAKNFTQMRSEYLELASSMLIKVDEKCPQIALSRFDIHATHKVIIVKGVSVLLGRTNLGVQSSVFHKNSDFQSPYFLPPNKKPNVQF